MEKKDILSGICPECGEKLEIPAHLSAFSCLYCGARLCPADITQHDTTDGQSAAEYYKTHICETITQHRYLETAFGQNAYVPAMEKYEAACREVFVQLEAAYDAKALTVQEAVDWFLNRLEDHWNKECSQKKHQKTDRIRERDKFILAVFLVPMIRHLNLTCIEDYCTVLHRTWMERYPKDRWNIGDYNDIASSFQRKHFGMCFITTAVCLEEGKEDNCAELTAFRSFRDQYLCSCPDGPALIGEYYRIAPRIVMEIDWSDNPRSRYAAIRKEYLDPCYADLQAGNYERCKTRYTEMVFSLQEEYLN